MRRERTRARDARVWSLRVRGQSFREIAQECGFSGPAGAHAALQRARAEMIRPAAEYQRDLVSDGLDAMTARAWLLVESPGPTVSGGQVVVGPDGRPVPDQRVVIEALRLLCQVEERRARLLGLDAPKRQTVSVISDETLDSEIERLTRDLERRTAPLQLEAGGGDGDGAE